MLFQPEAAINSRREKSMKKLIIFARRIAQAPHEAREQRLALAMARTITPRHDPVPSHKEAKIPSPVFSVRHETEKIAA